MTANDQQQEMSAFCEMREVCRQHLCKFDDPDWIAEENVAMALQTLDTNPTDVEIRGYLQEYGEKTKGGSRRISLDNFTNIMLDLMNKNPAEELREAFKTFAGEGKDCITVAHFRKIMEHFDLVEEKDLDAVVTKADTNGDGVIDIDEFVRALTGHLD